jgi:hypothetical protein
LTRSNLIAVATLAIVALFLGVTVATRMSNGSCTGTRRGRLDCTYAPGTFTAKPKPAAAASW